MQLVLFRSLPLVSALIYSRLSSSIRLHLFFAIVSVNSHDDAIFFVKLF
jgi:hypothetical protein